LAADASSHGRADDAAHLLKDKAENGLGIISKEIEKLKADYENLDRRTKAILGVVLVFSDLDLFSAN
jgi:hypothetical protein